MNRRRLMASLGLAASLILAGCGEKSTDAGSTPKELNFSILSAESQQNMSQYWQPLLDDMSAQIGVRVKPFYATNYTALVEAMRFKQVQIGWFSADPALEAVKRADGEVLSRVVLASGTSTYQSVVIARKGSGVTLDKLLKCDKHYTFGMGDPKSTSGTLAPMAYLFTPRDIDPAKCFKTVRNANHQANFMAVANGVLDAATNNTVGLLFYHRQNAQLADKVETLWTSPPLPESSILVRKDLDPALKEKIRQFFLTYGTGTGPQADRQRKILQTLDYAGFKPADDTYLDQIREMYAILELADAKKSGNKARIDQAQAALDKIRARISQQHAIEPDV